jgi:hypothetical protein
MNRFRSMLFAGAIFLALSTSAYATMIAQQATGSASDAVQDKQTQGDAHSGMPSVEEHLKFLSQALALTSEQQDKARPILKEMQDGMLKLRQDESLTDEQRRDQMKAVHEHADKSFRPLLSDEQKKKLDQLEQQSHPEPGGKG